MENETNRTVHTRVRNLIFWLKSRLLRIRRAVENAVRGPSRHHRTERLRDAAVVAVSKSVLWNGESVAEQRLVAGKVQNLRVAAGRLNGVVVPAGEVFSFWRQMGRATRRRGYVEGRELREGCLVPSIGGGLCQISNAIYDAALSAGLEIVERHPHTKIIPGSLAEVGRDATVFWNYLDLRVRSSEEFRLEVEIDREHLTVRIRSAQKRRPVPILKRGTASSVPDSMGGCDTCGVDECYRSLEPANEFGRTAFLLDEFSPEFDAFVGSRIKPHDRLFVPLDGKRFRKANYAWTAKSTEPIQTSTIVTLRRAWSSRSLSTQGAARQSALLGMSERLAGSYARRLRFDDLHLVVSQNLLPFLWRDGVLAGRTFDVLMTGFPIRELQSKLDAALKLHTESTTLGDFRAPAEIEAAETRALAAARSVVTPHRFVAQLFGPRGVVLDWSVPNRGQWTSPSNSVPIVIFPASTLGRKGAYELRESLRGLPVKLCTIGRELEGPDFWEGIDWESAPFDANWLERADLVVLPSFVEHRPRRILEAAASGVPVIASRECGVEGGAGIETVPAGDPEVLRSRIKNILSL